MPPSVVEGMNLGFEASDRPEGWFAGGKGYVATLDEDEKQAGERSLRLEFREAGDFGVATSRFPVEIARGKRLRLSGFLRTKEITSGWAGLWMRVDGPDGVLAFDNMQDRGITGTTEWTRHEIVLDVPEDATNINFGALLTGNGTAWIDSLGIEFAGPLAPPPIITVRGVVTGPDGKPVGGAHVALIRAMSDRATARTRSDEGGRFALVVPAAEYAITATAMGLTAAYVAPTSFGTDNESEERHVRLGEGGITLHGIVSDDTGKPVPGAVVRVMRLSGEVADIFYTETDDRGRYELDPLPGDGFVLLVESEDHVTLPSAPRGMWTRC